MGQHDYVVDATAGLPVAALCNPGNIFTINALQCAKSVEFSLYHYLPQPKKLNLRYLFYTNINCLEATKTEFGHASESIQPGSTKLFKQEAFWIWSMEADLPAIC